MYLYGMSWAIRMAQWERFLPPSLSTWVKFWKSCGVEDPGSKWGGQAGPACQHEEVRSRSSLEASRNPMVERKNQELQKLPSGPYVHCDMHTHIHNTPPPHPQEINKCKKENKEIFFNGTCPFLVVLDKWGVAIMSWLNYKLLLFQSD